MANSFSIAKALMLLLIIMIGFCGFSMGAVYDVGDEAGWRSMDHTYYQDWASNKNFRVGDTLVFYYNPQINENHYISYTDYQYHNVKQVTQDDFESCNGTSPIASYIDGFNKITLDKPGHYYFICGYPDHCMGGQKVDIMVTPASPVANPNAAPYYQPSLNNAPSLYSSQLWLIISVVLFVCRFS